MISNLHVMSGQDVAVFMLLKNNEPKTFCYSNALYDVCPVPFYGKYNDYGAVEDCHGHGLNVVVEAMRQQLYEFGQGPNSIHDCEVNQKNFDVELMFEADLEDRLGIQFTPYFNSDEYDLRELEKVRGEAGLTQSQQFELDRLATKLKKVDNFRAVTHVIVHGDIFRAIMDKWYIEEYEGEGKGTHGYEKSYNHFYFKDLEASIPEYIRRLKEQADERKRIEEELAAVPDDQRMGYPSMKKFFRSLTGDVFEWNDPCVAGKWMNSFKRDSTSTYGLIDVLEVVNELCELGEWDKLATFAKEVLTTAWINSYMGYTRKMWVKQSGAGGQCTDHLGFHILIDAMAAVMNAEDAEYGREDDDAA
jgi:hypothetical protein